MAETPIRWECVKRIIELAQKQEALAGVNVEPGWPGALEADEECIYLDHLDGPLIVPVTKAETARVNYDDTFTMNWQTRIAGGGRTRIEVMARLFEIRAAFHDVIATKSQLDNLDGVVSARITYAREESDDVGAMGFFGFASLDITVESRLV